ncbi:MAG: Bug family tripartite tricarboxylate transporter substrate binding protein [Candidatus Methylomirabilia bacterium]
MKKRYASAALLLALVVAVSLVAGPAAQAAYPEKPIQLIVTWNPGGRTDRVARVWAEVAAKHFGRPVAVVNKPGGGGTKGTIYVHKAKPDGYTLMATTIGNQVLGAIKARVPYKHNDFEAVGQITTSSVSIFANKKQPFHDLKSLVAYAKKNPGKVTYSGVRGGLPMLAIELFAESAGIKLRHVHYKGDAKAIPAALGGHVNFAVASSASVVLQHLRAGTADAYVFFNARPDPFAPEVPTAQSLGYDVVANPWTGIAAPQGAPAAILAKIRDVFQKTIADPEMKRLMEKIGESLDVLDHEQFAARWDKDYQQFKPLMERLGLTPK